MPCGGRGPQDWSVHPSRLGRTSSLHRPAGDNRQGRNGTAGVRSEEINDCAGKHLDLHIGPRRLAFTAETFILSLSLPNFYFHAVTAYKILGSRGVPFGKRDFEGRLRTSAF